MTRIAASLIATMCCWSIGSAGAAGIDAGAPKAAVVTSQIERKADTYRLPVAPFGKDAVPVVAINGLTRWTAMRVDGARTEDMIRGYRNRLTREGFEIVLDCTGRDCGGFDFRFGVDLLPPPDMQVDVADFAQLSLRRFDPPGIVSVLTSAVRGDVYIQTVTVEPADGDVSLSRPDQTVVQDSDTGIETAATAPSVAPAAPDVQARNFGSPYDRLITEGHLAITGVSFATGGSQIAAESAPALDRVAQMLRDNEDLKVAIVGHSDNQGGLNANIALSQRRAEAVLRALVRRGIAAGRLEARGIGYLSPLRANTTEEGRAINRRVELVVR